MSVLDNMRNHAVEFCKERCTELIMVDFITTVRLVSTHDFLLNPKETLALWVSDYDTEILFFIMDLTHYCFTREGVALRMLNQSLVIPMAETYSTFHNDANVPEEMSGEYCPSFNYLEKLFTNSTWTLLILILKTIPLERLTGIVVNPIAPKTEHTS